MVAGQVQQLQSGDTLSGPFEEIEGQSMTSGEAGGIVIGAPVYVSAVDTVKKGQANAAGTVKLFGLAQGTIATTGIGYIQTSGVLAATTGEWDAVAGTTGGLAYGVEYYLSKDTAGLLTATAPTAVGDYVVSVGIASSTTELQVRIQRPILL
jgi:hypothetical protein